ncbi:MAG TPA: DUF5694 domain-containing protein [Bacteroidota bacterium]|nr:DUF5694 domain-containing protein [Bacteroidota bacterium]
MKHAGYILSDPQLVAFTMKQRHILICKYLKMKIVFFLAALSMSSSIAFGQYQESIKSPSSFFPKEKVKVLVVGTFHFHYPNLDVNKIEDKDKIDVLIEPKRSEVTELVNYIKKFKPTKIAIEASPGWNAREKLKKYKAGEYRNERDERFQLAMRLANELALDSLYSIDAESFDNDLMKLDSAFIQKLFKDFDFKSSDSYDTLYREWYDYEDKLPSRVNLLEYFKHLNSEEVHKLGHGAYLVGDFKLDNERGPDILSIWWYNRNLRIFRKLQEITESKNDRILIIIGNGHVSILRELLESSPEYEFIEFDKMK